MTLYWMNKISWSAVLIIAWSVKVREKKGDHLSDAMATVGMVVSVGAIWITDLRATMIGAGMATVAAPVAAVAVSTYAIGGVIAFAAADPEDEGYYGAEALKEYYHDPIGTLVDIGDEYIVDPVADWTQEQIIDPVVGWTLRRVYELNQAKAELESTIDEYLFKNRWLTGPVLPF
jgi:hypothetical protein